MSLSAALFQNHPARDAALRELHARPALQLEAKNALILRFVFTFEPSETARDTALIEALCLESQVAPPDQRSRALQFRWRGLMTRWERHNEFVTYTFIAYGLADEERLSEAADRLFETQPGLLVAKLKLTIKRTSEAFIPSPDFLCASLVGKGRAMLQTSFTDDAEGAVNFNLTCGEVSDGEVGTLAQHVMEVEMYRMLALLALPIARRVGAVVRDAENEVGSLTQRLSDPASEDAVEELFNELTAVSGGIEREIATSTYRFSAARAYGALVEERLQRLQEEEIGGRPRIGSFMMTRLIPALRTCESMHFALKDLADRTTRLMDLIRTRIDLQLSRQNVALLTVINRRTQLQFRLQQTVEGLSVAAISYYILGLMTYVVKGAATAGLFKIESEILHAALVPPVVLVIWLGIRRLRKQHGLD